ncbi:hypothetical protein DV451_002049 [Geotrichum candidum]|uniref:t-SNARE affecting a late Golgi compartment protein 1 n=1 Tax=Geotrichum candidum TaxID=1173061 RepID=A0A9P5KTT6_GEOCN|nr:hypothetical protein DV451_002049 [Geotrichum candidum]KAF5108464.1 hypothetical protein DV453_002250 [Geotrichum candidum]KAF5124613.1 hypothetical protein DV495_003877 [Geotrichum candidum]
MDPFNQVYSDALGQLKSAEQLLDDYRNNPSTFYIEDLNNVVQELVETIHDLSQSTGVVQANPAQFGLSHSDVAQRITQVGNLNSQLTDIQESIAKIRRERENKAAVSGSGRRPADEDDNGMGGTGNTLMYQEAIASQDNMLDSVYNTVSNLNQQAHIMSQELEDQSNLIEDFERQVDTSQDRLARGMKRVNWVIENNRETLSSCCITLLIVALIVLLVLLLVL